MKKLTEEKARALLREYFRSRRVEMRGADGQVVVGKNGAALYEEKPSTVTGVALALGFSRREELDAVGDKKVKALIDRALLRVEESAEERLFGKESFQGAKLFLTANFPRWAGAETEADTAPNLGVCSSWAE